MVVVTEDLVRYKPDIVQEVFRLFQQGCEMAPDLKKPSTICCDKEGVRNAVKMAIQYSLEQKLISKSFDFDEIFAL
jgi:hypothetical protein